MRDICKFINIVLNDVWSNIVQNENHTPDHVLLHVVSNLKHQSGVNFDIRFYVIRQLIENNFWNLVVAPVEIEMYEKKKC